MPNGKLRKGGFKGKTEARLAAQEMIKQIDRGIVANNNITVVNYYNSWLEAENKQNLSPGQYDWYIRSRDMLTEKFGEKKLLKALTRQDIQALLNDYADGRTKETVRKVMVCLKKPLKDAAYEGLIERDPTYDLKNNGNKPAQSPEEKHTSLSNYFKLIEYFRSRKEKSYILLFLIAITGARFSEVNNMGNKELNYKLGYVFLMGTKTDTSPRAVELSTSDIEHVKKALSHYPKNINGKLFGISNEAALKSLKHAQKEIGMKEEDWITVYGLRHTHASYLISEQFDITYIGKRLGHATTNTTTRIYVHLLDEQREKEGKRVRQLKYK